MTNYIPRGTEASCSGQPRLCWVKNSSSACWGICHIGVLMEGNKIKNLLGPIYRSSDPWSLMSGGKWAADITWPMSSQCQLSNEKLMSVCQWAADITWPMSSQCSLPMSSLCSLANKQLMSVGQWAADVSWPMSSSLSLLVRMWFQLANEQLTSEN